MKLRPLLFAASALACLAAGDRASAQVPADVTYDVVTSFASAPTHSLTVTGVRHGESAPSTQTFHPQGAEPFGTCERMLLVMINRPGRFRLTLTNESYVYQCTLAAN